MKQAPQLPPRHMPANNNVAALMLLSSACVTVILGTWVLSSLMGMLRPSIIPPPWDIANAIYTLAVSGFAGHTLQTHIITSLGRFAAGFSLAAIIGIPLGLIMGWCAPARYVVTPFFELFRFIAPLAWLPFAALWFGTGIGGPILIVFSGAFAPCVINTFHGTRLIDPVMIEASRTLGATSWRLMVDILVPGAFPSILAGLRVSAALAWQSLIGAELIAATSGVGYLIVQGQGSFETSIVIAGMISIGIVGVIIDALLRLASDRASRKWTAAEA